MVKKMSEGVGKKIVEALRKQSEIEITPIPEANNIEENIDIVEDSIESADAVNNMDEDDNIENLFEDDTENNQPIMEDLAPEPEIGMGYKDISIIEEPVMQAFNYQKQAQNKESFRTDLENFEIPSNILVLKKLISQLPNGVSKHTGAQIIKQTMEALGISMKGVLQEAQQVQDGLSSSAKECMSSIQEYKKHILVLEKQAQNYHRQYTSLNELISLFIQTGV